MRIILQLLSLNGLSPELELSSHCRKEDKGCSKNSEYFEETKTKVEMHQESFCRRWKKYEEGKGRGNKKRC